MAISAISSVSSLPAIAGPAGASAIGRGGRASAVEALARVSRERPEDRSVPAPGSDVASLSASNAISGAAKAGFGSTGAPATTPGLDRRGPESLVDRNLVGFAAADRNGVRKPSRTDLEGRLADLQAEKAALERNRLGATNQKAAEVSSVIAQLKARDGEVKGHEAAHIAAGGRFITGGASYSYQRGPDGVDYAIGGEVGIDSSPIPGKPEETIAKMQVVRAAALAPAEPSGADLSVAGAAAQAEAQAVAQLAEERSTASAPEKDSARRSNPVAAEPANSDSRDAQSLQGPRQKAEARKPGEAAGPAEPAAKSPTDPRQAAPAPESQAPRDTPAAQSAQSAQSAQGSALAPNPFDRTRQSGASGLQPVPGSTIDLVA